MCVDTVSLFEIGWWSRIRWFRDEWKWIQQVT